tara:strand:+ start:674 stop:1723 length:1050 start_codon:yes stop_codon:yes gene_type:complete
MAYISFQPKDYFKCSTYTGNETARTITTGFEPTLVWTKCRNDAHHHICTDQVTGAGKRIKPNNNDAQDVSGASVASFISTGYTLTDNSTINGNSDTNVSWAWKMNGAGSADNSGSASNVTVSADATRGMSMVRWQGSSSAQTVPHGLGGVPDFIVMKEQTATGNWIASNKFDSWNGYLLFNLNNAFYNSGDASSGSGRMFKAGGTEPTSTLFSTNGSAYMDSTSNYNIGWFFRSVNGFSKMGKYIGNNSANGTFIYTGFKPSLFIFKRNGATNDWGIFDNRRSTFNEVDKGLKVNDNATEYTGNDCDFLANGVKMRSNGGDNNAAATYFYMAFAEEPLVASNGDPATAR